MFYYSFLFKQWLSKERANSLIVDCQSLSEFSLSVFSLYVPPLEIVLISCKLGHSVDRRMRNFVRLENSFLFAGTFKSEFHKSIFYLINHQFNPYYCTTNTFKSQIVPHLIRYDYPIKI